MKIVILGNGISGITAARVLRQHSDHEIVVVSDESDEFFSRTALMYVYMGHLRLRDTMPYEPWFWEKNRIQRLRARIGRIDFEGKTLYGSEGQTIGYDKLLLALGSRSNRFGWPGQDLDGVQGLYHLHDLERLEQHSAGLKRAVVVGGGLIGVEMAEMLHSREIPVTFLVRENDFWANVLPPEEAAMVSRHLREHQIDLRLETELQEILDDGRGRCRAVVTSRGETIDCGLVGLAVGVSPNIGFLKNTALETNRGILVNEFLETNLPGVYAAGDCAELRQPPPGRKAIEAVWYTGRMMGETAAHNMLAECGMRSPECGMRNTEYGICGTSHTPESCKIPHSAFRIPHSAIPYSPGIWFNSAKFFDIEYQVYGDIRPVLPPEQATVYWEHPDGRKSIRINYERVSRRVLGFQLMGIRYRQEVCNKWLGDGATIESVLLSLGLANFDPEFSAQHEAALLRVYNQQAELPLPLLQRRGLPAVLKFLRNA